MMENAITITELIMSLMPIAGGIIGVYVKLTNLTAQQEIKIKNLEIRATAHSNRIKELDSEVMKKLNELTEKIDDVRLHAFKCVNYKPAQ
jgi:hypothetical protein